MSVVRFFTLLGTACLIVGFVLIAIGGTDLEAAGGLLVTASFVIGGVLWFRRAFFGVRGLASDAKSLFSGDVKEVRVVSVGPPKGLFHPRSTVQVEVEEEDGTKHAIDREVWMPWPLALVHRWASSIGTKEPPLDEALAGQLRRQGLEASVAGAAQDPAATPEADSATTRT